MKTARIITLSALALSAAISASAQDNKIIVREPRVVRVNGNDPFVLYPGDPVKRGYLGVHLTDLTPELRQHFGAKKDAGVLVSSISDDSPAARAGIRVGDVITQIDGKSAASPRVVEQAIRGRKEGDRIQIDLLRDRASRSVTATIAEREMKMVDLSAFERFPAVFDAEIRPGVEKLGEYLKSPEWKTRVTALSDCGEKMQTRLKELEKRLGELEKKTGN